MHQPGLEGMLQLLIFEKKTGYPPVRDGAGSLRICCVPKVSIGFVVEDQSVFAWIEIKDIGALIPKSLSHNDGVT